MNLARPRSSPTAGLLTPVVFAALFAFGWVFGERAAKNVLRRYEEARLS